MQGIKSNVTASPIVPKNIRGAENPKAVGNSGAPRGDDSKELSVKLRNAYVVLLLRREKRRFFDRTNCDIVKRQTPIFLLRIGVIDSTSDPDSDSKGLSPLSVAKN